jgi:hypothetical protein
MCALRLVLLAACAASVASFRARDLEVQAGSTNEDRSSLDDDILTLKHKGHGNAICHKWDWRKKALKVRAVCILGE